METSISPVLKGSTSGAHSVSIALAKSLILGLNLTAEILPRIRPYTIFTMLGQASNRCSRFENETSFAVGESFAFKMFGHN